jgi:PKD repeat protein
MNLSVSLIRTTLISVKVSLGLLLLFQVSSCDLEVIPPTQSPGIKSNFSFAIQNPDCTADCVVNFTNLSENATTYEWNFGDESSVSTTKDPQHTFSNPGSYNVTLTAIRDTLEDDTTMVVLIEGGIPGGSTFEAFTHTALTANITGQVTSIDHTKTNNSTNKIVVVSSVLGLRNQSAHGVYYWQDKWTIFNQDITNIKENEIFTVVTADPSDPGAFVHQTTSANLRALHISTLDHPSVNNRPNARVFVTAIWEKSTDYNNHPVGVVYVNNRWEIINLDQSPLPVDLKFNVIVSENNNTSFIHTSTASSVISDYTLIGHALTDEKPEAKILCTFNQGTNASPIGNPRLTGLWYSSSPKKWTIFNENFEGMPQNAKYNILVLE